MDTDDRARQPLVALPALQRLIVHEPWLADASVRARAIWDREGWGGCRYAFFVLDNSRRETLGLLLRDGNLHYCRMYPDYTLAVLDGTKWAREVNLAPEQGLLAGGGLHENGQIWGVRVVRRHRRWEVHLTHNGLIPLVSDFAKCEDAQLAAENWLTAFHHQDDD
jgi:hypothetical protein